MKALFPSGRESFKDPDLYQIVEQCYQLIDEGCELRVDQAIDRVSEPKIKTLLSKIGVAPMLFDNLERTARDCMHAIKKRSLNQKFEEIKKQRNEALTAGESERSQKLQDQLRELRIGLISG